MSTTKNFLAEILQIVKRMETRMMRAFELQGLDVYAGKPEFRAGFIHVPTPSTSLARILSVVPPSWPTGAPLWVCHEGTPLAEVYLPQPHGVVG